jgi:hypothetical protein
MKTPERVREIAYQRRLEVAILTVMGGKRGVRFF